MSARVIPGEAEGTAEGAEAVGLSVTKGRIHERWGYSIWPAKRKSGKGSAPKTRLNQPSARSMSVTNECRAKLYLKYSIFSSRAPKLSLKRRSPSLAMEVRPRCRV